METGVKTGFRASYLWGAAFFISSFGGGALTRWLDTPGWVTWVVVVSSMPLLLPFVRSMERQQAQLGCLSPAIRAYNRRLLWFTLAYVLSLSVAIYATKALAPTGILAWGLAVLPSLPILYMVYALGRYLAEESDEYLRMKSVTAALFGTGFLLVVSTFWGFLETFGLVAHHPSWWAVPIWSIGLGLGNVWQWLRSR